jgi:N-acetylglucosamine kinase-like BadF-type ATPase
MKSRSDLIIGVDGGGTKTVAWIAPIDDPSNAIVLGRGLAGPGNPRAAGFNVALSNIESAIAAAVRDAGLEPVTAAAACFGLAGAGREMEQQRIAAWARDKQIADIVRVTGDAEPILAAASPENCGVALICGTGSLAWGRNAAGDVARCGGWGYLFGDEGSGYSIACAALKAVARAADGRSEPTVLLDHFRKQLGAAGPQDLIECIYSPQMTRERIASVAKAVFDAAADDAIAQSLVAAAAADLAEMVATLCRRLSLACRSYPLAFAGSVIANQPMLRSQLLERLATADLLPRSEVVVTDAVAGCLSLARSVAKSTSTGAARCK